MPVEIGVHLPGWIIWCVVLYTSNLAVDGDPSFGVLASGWNFFHLTIGEDCCWEKNDGSLRLFVWVLHAVKHGL